ncbi:hypothetical protein ES703_38841 [subsurface metagenome]
MKIKGQHGEFGWAETPHSHHPVPKRKVEIEEGERIKIMAGQQGKEQEVMDFFIPGVLTVDWEADAKIEEK